MPTEEQSDSKDTAATIQDIVAPAEPQTIQCGENGDGTVKK